MFQIMILIMDENKNWCGLPATGQKDPMELYCSLTLDFGIKCTG